MLKRPVIGLGAAALALGGCSGGNTVNEGAAQNRPEAAPENQASAVAQGGRPIALDERRLVEACLPASERQLTIEQLSRARRLALNRCYNEETVRQLTPQLPIRIDPLTEVVQVSAEEQDLVYRYRIGRPRAGLAPDLAERLEADTRRHACAGEDVRNTIALGGAQVYRWVDRDDALIREVRVGACPGEGNSQ